MSSPVEEWRAEQPGRHADELEYGTTWTTEAAPGERWRLVWNTGTGELYTTRDDKPVDVLGTYSRQDDVDHVLAGWGQRVHQGGGLDWVRRQCATMPWPDVADHDGGPFRYPDRGSATSQRLKGPVYAVTVGADGNHRYHQHPVDLDPTAPIEAVPLHDERPNAQPLVMLVGSGDANGRSVNAAATRVVGTGWPIHGDATVVPADLRQPLDQYSIDRVSQHCTEPPIDQVPDREIAPPVANGVGREWSFSR